MADRAGSMATGVQFMNKARTYGTLLAMQCGQNFHIILYASSLGCCSRFRQPSFQYQRRFLTVHVQASVCLRLPYDRVDNTASESAELVTT